MIPDYIREHVLNAQPPGGCCVPEGSVPALAEGHFTSARVATVGINPHGSWNRKDFLPRGSLTMDRDDLNEQFLSRVWEEKTRYFERNRYRYFTTLQPILSACGATYGGRYGTGGPDLACFPWTWSSGPQILCGASCRRDAQLTPRESFSLTVRPSLRGSFRRTAISNCCWATEGPSSSSSSALSGCDSTIGR